MLIVLILQRCDLRRRELTVLCVTCVLCVFFFVVYRVEDMVSTCSHFFLPLYRLYHKMCLPLYCQNFDTCMEI